MESVRLRMVKGSARSTEPLFAIARDAVVDLGVEPERAASVLGLEPGRVEVWVKHRRIMEEALS
jgi:hypothetical protein